MYPTRETAAAELELAGKMNPGPWTRHSLHTAQAAQIIASHCGMDSEKAFVCGLLHDIGRRIGIVAVRHVIEGYDYATKQGWDEVARICLTHSYPIQDIDADIGKMDITDEQYRFMKTALNALTYDDYDKLIILCDAIADANGFCILEKRLMDTTRRYGIYPFSLDRWNKTFEYKSYFEQKIGTSLYRLLPDIEKCIYVDPPVPPWN